jgi:hypothetical protein
MKWSHETIPAVKRIEILFAATLSIWLALPADALDPHKAPL